MANTTRATPTCIGRATLYQYFDDKRDLLVALADRITRRVTDAVAARTPLVIPDGLALTELGQHRVALKANLAAERAQVRAPVPPGA